MLLALQIDPLYRTSLPKTKRNKVRVVVMLDKDATFIDYFYAASLKTGQNNI
jgi:hypothetical protein